MKHVIVLWVPFTLILQFTAGRLTEFMTERFPILAHHLQHHNIDLNLLSRRAKLGTGSNFRLHAENDAFVTPKGAKRVRLVQTYAGHDVYGPTAAAEMNVDGEFTGHVFGEIAKDLHKDIPNPHACQRAVDSLINKVMRLENITTTEHKQTVSKKNVERVIHADTVRGRAKIVYVIEFLFTKSSGHVSFPVYYIDACSNRILFSFDKIKNYALLHDSKGMQKNRFQGFQKTDRDDYKDGSLRFKTELSKTGNLTICVPFSTGFGGNRKTGRMSYNTPPWCLPVKSRRGFCIMEGKYVKVVNNRNKRDMDKSRPVFYRCRFGYRDRVNGAFGVANDAFYFGEISGKFFEEATGQVALGFLPRMVVHYGRNYENAFWTGQDMFFGDGRRDFYPLVSLDIIAHELAHGFTTRNSNLVYKGQSGAINEAFSDIVAVTTAHHVYGKVNWHLGSSVIKAPGKAIRYMDYPPRDGKSIKSVFRYRPWMNVHYTSGVYNYAFYLMVNDTSMNINATFMDFVTANKLLWGKYTRFRGGACKVMQASYDSGTNFTIVRRSFLKTGMPLIFCSYNGLKTTLFPGETRNDIKVSKYRSPIFEINMSHWSGDGVSVETNKSSSKEVKIVLANDDEALHKVVTGVGFVPFPKGYSKIYVQLLSKYEKDFKVSLTVHKPYLKYQSNQV